MGNAAQKKCCTCTDEGHFDDQHPVSLQAAMEEVEDREVSAPSKSAHPRKGLLTITTEEESGSKNPAGWQGSRQPEDSPASDSQTVHYGDGSAYYGQMIDGQRHGQGVYKCGTEQYEGQWLYDKQHGSGCQTWSNGQSYKGQYDCGRFSGTGRMVWQTQKGMMVYEGEYADDRKHGTGKFCWPDGRVYDGEWYLGKRHGRGTYRTARGEYSVGHWTSDRFVRWETPQLEEDKVNIMLQ